MNNYISDISEIFANLFAVSVLKMLGYKKTIVASYLVAMNGMVALILVGLIIESPANWIIQMLVLLAKLGVSSAYLLSYLGNAKLFDQNILATTMGLCSCISRAANVLANPIADLKPEYKAEYVFVGTTGLACLLTIGLNMPATDEEEPEISTYLKSKRSEFYQSEANTLASARGASMRLFSK